MTDTVNTGAVIWEGPSALDGESVVLVLAARDGSTNTKTGPLQQLYILRADMDPQTASRTGADASICGDCRHRGVIGADGQLRGRTCYVVLWQGPRSVYATYRAGRYPRVDLETGAHMLVARPTRVGAYGDPAAIPAPVWQTLRPGLRAGSTAYTHQWRTRPDLMAFCMASVDSPNEYAEAKAAGWRTFRVARVDEQLAAREIACPASSEAGKRTTCAACKACGGLAARARADIAIQVHGPGARLFA